MSDRKRGFIEITVKTKMSNLLVVLLLHESESNGFTGVQIIRGKNEKNNNLVYLGLFS